MRPDDDDVVIVAALRTPMCRSSKGSLAGIPPSTLLQTVLEGVLQTTGIAGHNIDDICVGNVLLPPSGFAALRMAQIMAGIPETTSLHTVNRQCSSGLQACANIANSIAAKEITIGIGAGVESMSFYPMNKMKPIEVDWKAAWNNKTAMDCLLPMGITSENVTKKYGLQRHVMDEFAALSHQKAAAAQRDGKFVQEIIPVVGTICHDDGIRPQTTYEILSKLQPVFHPQGLTTAGNSSQTTDGAAAVLFMTRFQAKQWNLPILAIWRGYCTAGVPPHVMGIGPAVAIPKVLQQVGLTMNDIDIYEINEAFASQVTWCIEELHLDNDYNDNDEKKKKKKKSHCVNPNGGAIALGHPLGCTGARMVATLVHELQRRRRKARYGVVSMCIGSGMGAAAVIEVPTQSAL